MAGTFLGKYDTTSANNTTTGTNSVSVAEGMLPSNINNAFRSVMADIRQHYNDAEWIEYGDGAGTYTPTYVSSTSFTIDGVDVTTPYHVGRRIKVVATTPGTIYGSITATAFSTNTTVTVAWDSGSLSNEAITSVYLGVLSKTNSSIPLVVIGTGNVADDAITAAKMAVNSVDSDSYVDASIDLAHMSVNSIDSDQYVDASIDTAHLAADVITGAKIADDAIDSEHYTDASIDLAHMSVNSIDSDQYVDGSIDVAHMSADSVDSAQYVDGSIDNAHIADDAIDSEHYAAGSIDTAHIADVNVTLAKLATSSVNSSKIVDDSIVNADINSSAAIDATKIANGTVTSAEFQYINTLSSNAQTQINTKAATTYVDEAVAGLRTRIVVEATSTANVVIASALEAGDAIDGVTLVAGDQVLLKDQSTASQNGIYTAVGSGAGAASRSTEYNTIDEISGQMVVANQGTANDNTIWLCTTNSSASLGSDSITFTKITPSNSGTVTSIIAGTGLSGGTITGSGTIAIDTATTVDKTTSQTLTNKTLTTPVITSISNSGTVTIPSGADTLVGKATTDTFTNKTLDLGGTGNSLTGSLAEFNTALQSDSFTSLTGTETLTNKTLTSPKINEDVAVTSTATELNLLDGVSGLVQGDLTKLAAVDASAAEIDTLDALSRGSIIYGNASAATAILTKGTANQVLTSDGTDISWSAVDAGVSWQTIVTGSTLTAVAGRAYWINTTSNACTITLPSSASNGDQIIFADFARNWGTNSVTLDSNGLNYQGEDDSNNFIYSTSGETVNIVYSGATNGWIPLDDDAVAFVGPPPSTQKSIMAFGDSGGTSKSNLVNSSGVIAADINGVGTQRYGIDAASYGGDKGLYAFGRPSGYVNTRNLISNQGVIASDATGAGAARAYLSGTQYGTDTAIFAFGNTGSGYVNNYNLVNNTGVVASDTSGSGTIRSGAGSVPYGGDKAMYAYGYSGSYLNSKALVSNQGVVASNSTGVGTARVYMSGSGYDGGDKGIFAFGDNNNSMIGVTNLVSNTGSLASDTSAVGTARYGVYCSQYGGDKAIFAYGYTNAGAGQLNMKNLVNSSGVMASDATGVGSVRANGGACGFSQSA